MNPKDLADLIAGPCNWPGRCHPGTFGSCIPCLVRIKAKMVLEDAFADAATAPDPTESDPR